MAPVAAQTTHGPIDRVPCPWCGKANDFRTVDDLLADADEIQHDFNCDHCSKKMRVVSVRAVKHVFVRQVQ